MINSVFITFALQSVNKFQRFMEVVRVTDLWKKYQLGVIGTTSFSKGLFLKWTNRKDLNKITHNIYGSNDDDNDRLNSFWALKEINFSLRKGDVLGIIGKNGAGKSTLLKIISRITSPTKGKVHFKGRVSSLLEVGTGFHPDLTGKENVFLNGSILGMKRKEIQSKFDEIVDFAGVERFIDTPVKRYSSGMYVRLAFSVAAFLEPEIMIIDEVLAVGDIEFQRKCLGKMGEVASEGRTLLFVSHNMNAIVNICKDVIWLEDGKIKDFGPAKQVVEQYSKKEIRNCAQWIRKSKTPVNEGLFFTQVTILNKQGVLSEEINAGESFYIKVECQSVSNVRYAEIHLRIINNEGIILFTTTNADVDASNTIFNEGYYNFRIELPQYLLAPGQYSLNIAAIVPGIHVFDLIDEQIGFTVNEAGKNHLFINNRKGLVGVNINWQKLQL